MTPVRAPLALRNPARCSRCVWMLRTTTSRQRVSASGRAAKSIRSRQGKLRTHCRMGTLGMTWSTRCEAVSTIRRVPQDGQNPRFLHEKATSSWRIDTCEIAECVRSPATRAETNVFARQPTAAHSSEQPRCGNDANCRRHAGAARAQDHGGIDGDGRGRMNLLAKPLARIRN